MGWASTIGDAKMICGVVEVPEGHAVHDDAPEAAYESVLQVVQEVDPVAEANEPASHGVQTCCPEPEKVPTGQAWHAVESAQR